MCASLAGGQWGVNSVGPHRKGNVLARFGICTCIADFHIMTTNALQRRAALHLSRDMHKGLTVTLTLTTPGQIKCCPTSKAEVQSIILVRG